MIEVLHSDSLLNPFRLMCPDCGSVWGTVTSDKPSPTWYTFTRPCQFHSDRYRIGGSFFQDFIWGSGAPAEFLKKHPGLLRQEFNLMLDWVERFGESPPAFHYTRQLELL